jgi:hypothetical protein
MEKQIMHFCGIAGHANDASIGFATMVLNLPSRFKGDMSIDFSSCPKKSYEAFMRPENPANVFFCMPTYMDGLAFFDACANWKAGSDVDVIVATSILPEIEFEEAGKMPEVSHDAPVSETSEFVTYEAGEDLPKVFAIRKSEKLPASLRDVFRDPALKVVRLASPESAMSTFSKHVFAGCVGLRTHVR